jgi:colanic acid biosynthesis glycosyl transferase WcaI
MLPYREVLNGVNVMRAPHYVPPPARVTGLARILMELSFSLTALTWWVRILFRRRRYDAVVAVCPPIEDAFLPWLYRCVRRVPFIIHVQDFQVDAAIRLGLIRGGGLGRVLYLVENFLLCRAAVVSSITTAMCRRAAEKGVRSHTWLIPNWTNPRIEPLDCDNYFRRQLGLESGTVLVMYAGAIGKKQGLDCLLDAADLLRVEPTIQIVVIGTGADHARLTARAAGLDLPNLRFLPVQPEQRLLEMLAAADIHLAIQRREAADLVMPSKLTNIMAAGRPTIATAEERTALWDLLEGCRTGKCVPPDDPAALSAAIRALANDQTTLREMGRRAREYALTKLDKELILREFEQNLESLVTGTSTR